MNFTITINRLRVHAPLGVYDFEKTEGNDFEVTVVMETDIPRHLIEADDVDPTLDYAQVAAVVKAEMLKPRDLIETAALAVANAVKNMVANTGNHGESLGLTIKEVTVTVAKLSPPIPDIDIHSASATVTL